MIVPLRGAVPPLDTPAGVADGVRYWRYRTGGAGPRRDPVVLLHGLGGDHLGLRDLGRALPGVDVVELDLPGFGESDLLTGQHTVINYARMLEGLRVRLGLGSINLVGHSLGADIALVYASLYPRRIAALTLLNPIVDGAGPAAWLTRAYFRIGTWLPAALARVWLLSRLAVYLGDIFVLTTKDRTIRKRILNEDYRAAAATRPRAISEVYLSLVKTPFHELARQIVAPTLLVTGSRDSLAGPSTLRALGASIARSQEIVINGAGHLWAVEEPAEAAEVVTRNLR